MKLRTKILLVILQEMTRIVKCIFTLSYHIKKKNKEKNKVRRKNIITYIKDSGYLY
jgi:hypothetical protein